MFVSSGFCIWASLPEIKRWNGMEWNLKKSANNVWKLLQLLGYYNSFSRHPAGTLPLDLTGGLLSQDSPVTAPPEWKFLVRHRCSPAILRSNSTLCRVFQLFTEKSTLFLTTTGKKLTLIMVNNAFSLCCLVRGQILGQKCNDYLNETSDGSICWMSSGELDVKTLITIINKRQKCLTPLPITWTAWQWQYGRLSAAWEILNPFHQSELAQLSFTNFSCPIVWKMSQVHCDIVLYFIVLML